MIETVRDETGKEYAAHYTQGGPCYGCDLRSHPCCIEVVGLAYCEDDMGIDFVWRVLE